MFNATEGDGEQVLLPALCSEVDGGPVVVAGSARVTGTLRIYCGVDVVVVRDPSLERLSAVVRRLGGGWHSSPMTRRPSDPTVSLCRRRPWWLTWLGGSAR